MNLDAIAAFLTGAGLTTVATGLLEQEWTPHVSVYGGTGITLLAFGLGGLYGLVVRRLT